MKKKITKFFYNNGIILAGVFMLFCETRGNFAGMAWAGLLMVTHGILAYANNNIFREVIEYYPKKDCVYPQYCKFLFEHFEKDKFSEENPFYRQKGVPKELYTSSLVTWIGFCVISVLIIILAFFNQILPIGYVVGGYFVIVVIMMFVGLLIMTQKRFLAQFKKKNKHNKKYYWSGRNDVLPEYIGQCNILSTAKADKYIWAKVFVIETGAVKENVIVSEDLVLHNTTVYNLYEICKVYYIE